MKITQLESIAKNDDRRIFEDEALYIERKTALSSEDTAGLWEVINQGFAAINSRSGQLQSMEYNEFLEDIDSEKVLKFIARDNSDQRIIGYLSVHVGLDAVSWVDTTVMPVMRDIQEQVDASAESYYISTFVVPPSMQGLQLGGHLLNAALTDMYVTVQESGAKTVAFFDCAEENYPGIPQYAERIAIDLSDNDKTYSVAKISETTDVSGEKPHVQHYFSLKISKNQTQS